MEKKLPIIMGIVAVFCVLVGLAFLRMQTPTSTFTPTPLPSPTPSPVPTPSPPYSSTFHLLFKDEIGIFLGNLTGEFKVIQNDSTLHSTFKFTFSSIKQNQPCIETLLLLTTYTFYVYDGQGPKIMPAPPLPRNITINADEQITLFNFSTDISNYKEPTIVFGFARDPTIWIHLSNGQLCVWKPQQGANGAFPLWSGGHEWRLTELAGKSETATATITLTLCRLILETDREIYQPGENVTLILKNVGSCSVRVGGYPAWQIFTLPEEEPVYPKVFATLAWTLQPGENRTFIWNQYNQFKESYCSPGTYIVKDTQGWGLSTSFQITQKVVEKRP